VDVSGPNEGFIPVRLGRARWSRITTTMTFFSVELDMNVKSIIPVPTGISGVNDPAAFVTAFEDQTMCYASGVHLLITSLTPNLFMTLIPYVTTAGLWPSYGWNYDCPFNKLIAELLLYLTHPTEHSDDRDIILAHQSECEHALLANNLKDDLSELDNTLSSLSAHTCAVPESFKLRVRNLYHILQARDQGAEAGTANNPDARVLQARIGNQVRDGGESLSKGECCSHDKKRLRRAPGIAWNDI